jgi:SAM-dependent methyltransferase
MAVYDLLAAHYDAVTGDSATEAAFVDDLIKHSPIRVATLLEIACGTGSIMASLADRYQVSGLDISPGMLAIAREKLPQGTPLYLADMRHFKLSTKFDAVICVYHGINHLLDFAAWESFFSCAHMHLNEGGTLIFDVLTINDLKAMASIPEIVQQYGENHLVIRVRASEGVVFDWNIEVFGGHRDDGHLLLTEVIRTASFRRDSILKALSKRFSSISVINSTGSLVDDGSEKRTWFVCTGQPRRRRARRAAR